MPKSLKKIIGIVLIVLGVLALLTPFTPGSWLIFIGLGFLGFRLIIRDGKFSLPSIKRAAQDKLKKKQKNHLTHY